MRRKQNQHRCFTTCGIVEIDGKILLVRHTYGAAKDRILLPGGYVKSDELPTAAAEREILEETAVVARTRDLFCIQFKPDQWCTVFTMDYVCGHPQADGYENSEVLLMKVDDALARDDITNMSREILKSYKLKCGGLAKSEYIAKSCTEKDYALYGV